MIPKQYFLFTSKFYIGILIVAAWMLLLCSDGTSVYYLFSGSSVLLLLLAYQIWTGEIQPRVMKDALPSLVVIFTFLIIIIPLWSIAPYRSWFYGWVWLVLPLSFFLYLSLKIHVNILMVIVTCSGALLALLGLYQFHLLPQEFAYRASGLLLDANSFAGLINLLLLPSIACLISFSEMESKPRLFVSSYMLLAVILMVGGVVSTGSRAGIAIMIIGIAILLLLRVLRRESLGLLFIIMGVVIFWLAESFMIAGDAMLQRYESIDLAHDPSLSARFMLWDSCWELFLSNSFWGMGMGSFYLLYPKVRAIAEAESFGAYVHSDPLQLLLEGGVLSLIIFMLIILYAAYFLYVNKKNEQHKKSFLFTSIALSILLAAAHACVNFNFYNACILFICGVYLACLYSTMNDKEDCSSKDSALLLLLWRRGVPILCVGVAVLLIADLYAAKLQRPLVLQGFQAEYSESECEHFEWLEIIRPSMPGMKLGRSVCELKSQNCEGLKRAIKHVNEAISVSPYQSELYAFAAQLYLLAPQCIQDSSVKARGLLVQAIDYNPTYLPVRFMLYQIDSQNGHLNRSRRWLTEGLEYGMHHNQRNQLQQWLKQLE